jgi:hypothetical protein
MTTIPAFALQGERSRLEREKGSPHKDRLAQILRNRPCRKVDAIVDCLSVQFRYARDRWWMALSSPRKRVRGNPSVGSNPTSTAAAVSLC